MPGQNVREPGMRSEAAEFCDVFRALEGRWQLSRRMNDGSSFSGSADFIQESSGRYRMEERGQLLLASGRRLGAGRTWFWELVGPELLEIRFAGERGGELYHRVEFGADGDRSDRLWRGCASHLCGADIYDGTYMLRVDRIDIRHAINGPAKSMNIESLLLRDTGFRA